MLGSQDSVISEGTYPGLLCGTFALGEHGMSTVKPFLHHVRDFGSVTHSWGQWSCHSTSSECQSTENRQESQRERNFVKASLQLLASLLGVRGGLPSRPQGRHSTKRTSCRSGLQGFVVPIKRAPEPKCVACNAHLRGHENTTQVTGFRSWLTRASGLMVWSWTPKQTSGHRSTAWVMWEIWEYLF